MRRVRGAALPATALAVALLAGVPAPAASAAVAPGTSRPASSAASLGASARIGLETPQHLATRPVAATTPVAATVVRTAPTLAQRQAAARAAAAAARAAVVARVLRVAASLRGRPYAYGGTGPASFDCSGYTRYVFRLAAHRLLPHSSAAQASAAHRIARSAVRPGDLVFFTSGGHVYHVAIYAGHGLIWHAPHTGDHVRLQPIPTSSWVAGRVL